MYFPWSDWDLIQFGLTIISSTVDYLQIALDSKDYYLIDTIESIDSNIYVKKFIQRVNRI